MKYRFENGNFERFDEEKEEWVTVSITDVPILELICTWSSLITELSEKEIELENIKREFEAKEFQIKYIDEIDFKGLYGRANDDTRKYHVQVTLQDLLDKKSDLELSISYLKRMISFLRQVVPARVTLFEVRD